MNAAQACVYCGDPASTFDHTTPRSAGGTHTVPCCRLDNTLKGDMPYNEWLRWLATDDYQRARADLRERWLRRGVPLAGDGPTHGRARRRQRTRDRIRQQMRELSDRIDNNPGLPRTKPRPTDRSEL